MRYPLSIRVLHWLMAVFILGLLAVGLIMTDLPKDDPGRGLLYGLHKSFGITVLMLAVLRIALRFRLGTPPLPDAIPASEQKAAHLGHYALYLFMFAMPVSGYVLTNSFGKPVVWFGIDLPKLFSLDPPRGHLAADFHYYAAYTLMAMLVLHVAAVIWHYLRERVNLLKRMI